jgi:hypothetical protein
LGDSRNAAGVYPPDSAGILGRGDRSVARTAKIRIQHKTAMSNPTDLRFSISINSDLTAADIISAIKKSFPEFTEITAVALRESKNMMVMDKNDLHDPERINEPDGWLYYKHELSVFPVEATTLDHQRNLANSLLNNLANAGFLVELINEDP